MKRGKLTLSLSFKGTLSGASLKKFKSMKRHLQQLKTYQQWSGFGKNCNASVMKLKKKSYHCYTNSSSRRSEFEKIQTDFFKFCHFLGLKLSRAIPVSFSGLMSVFFSDKQKRVLLPLFTTHLLFQN